MLSHIRKYMIAGFPGLCLLFIWPAITVAGAIHVSPIALELTPHRPISVIKVQNQGDQHELIEITPFRWTQKTSQFDLDPAPELIITPPVFSLQPGQNRLVRVGIMTAELFGPDQETAFRLIIDKTTLGEDQAQIQIKTRISLPVYLPPDVAWRYKPEIALQQRPDNKILLKTHNPDNRRIRVFDITLQDNAGGKSVIVKNAGYILPRRWLEKEIKEPENAEFHTAIIRYSSPYGAGIQEEKVLISNEVMQVSSD